MEGMFKREEGRGINRVFANVITAPHPFPPVSQCITNCDFTDDIISKCMLSSIYQLFFICFVQFFKGIFMAAQLVLPKDCSGNAFCEITKMIIGPTAKFYITGQFEWKKVRVAVGFGHIRIWDGLYFDKLELYVEVSHYTLYTQLARRQIKSFHSYLYFS